MRYLRVSLGLILAVALLTSGCRTLENEVAEKHDEVLVYPVAFDLTYLRTLEALENVEGWELVETEKEKGILIAKSIDYRSHKDPDKNIATFWIRRIGRRETAIQFAPHSQHVSGGGELLERISQYMNRELGVA